MNTVFHFPMMIIFIPMIIAIITPLFRANNFARNVTVIGQALMVALCAALTVYFFNNPQGDFNYAMGAFPAPWGNELRAGLFEALLSLAFSTVMLLSVLGGAEGLKTDLEAKKSYLYYLMLNLISTSLMAMVFTNDLFTAYVFIEINTVAACSIVVAKENGKTLRATIKYLIMSILGSGLFLLSVTILYSLTGHLLMQPSNGAIAALAASGQYHLPLIVTLALFAVAVAVKCALFPFHTWLPDAHASATTTSSAVLSGLVLKGYIVLFIKLVYRVYGLNVVSDLQILVILFVLGLAGMVMGSIMAFRQTDMKRMIAYSSVAQIGYIFLGIGLSSPTGFTAAIYHIIAHAFTKGMLFVAAGSLIETAGTADIKGMTGSARKNRLAGIAFGVGALSMIGVPLFAGFVSKFYLAVGAMEGNYGTLIALIVLVLSTFLNALYYIPVLIRLFSKKQAGEEITSGKKISLATAFALVVFAATNLFLGIFYQPILEAIEFGISVIG